MKHQTIKIEDCRARVPAEALFGTIGPRFAIRAAADLAEISIYDEIGFWGITASDIRRVLDQVDAPNILLRINSPGGEVWDALAIYNDLVQHPAEVHVQITGIAASAASLIAMAGDTISIAYNGFIMIHNARTIALGDHKELSAVVEWLVQVNAALASTYAVRTGETRDEMAALMDAETWMFGAAAVDAGFADETFGADTEDAEDSAEALFDLSRFDHVPAALKRRTEDGLRAAGFSKREARAAVANGFNELPRREAADRLPRRDAGVAEDVLIEGADALAARIRAAAG